MKWVKNANHLLYRRASILYQCGALMCGTIILMLVYLQVFLEDRYLDQGVRNFTRYASIASPRGTITDTHGRPIATNRPIINVYWHGAENTHWDPYQRYALEQLEQILQHDLQDDPYLLQCERRGRAYRIARDISLDTLSNISEQLPHSPHIHTHTEFIRFYPYAWQAAHIIGHINRHGEGKAGLEKLCDQYLVGRTGYIRKHVTATGKVIDRSPILPAAPGDTVRTTLDIDMQACAENAFLHSDHNGVIICLDGINGDIQAVASHPSFDPNAFTGTLDTATWHAWQEYHALLNRACNAVYPPASVFKLITTACALEESYITPLSTWYCSGYTRYGRRIYACNRPRGHESITISDAIAHSCNIPFYEIGKEIPIDTLAIYAEKFGLNTPTGITLPEQSGLIPTHEWKEYTLHERWWQGETLAATIGQSYLLVTPLQIARMINAICQGYLVRPRILHSEPIHISPLDISHETQDVLRNATRTVVTDGRARDVGIVEQEFDGLTLYAKTGTAQTSHKCRTNDGHQFQAHGWFVVHAQYRYHSPITLVVLLEHIGSSRVAARTARNFIRSYCTLCDARDTDTA